MLQGTCYILALRMRGPWEGSPKQPCIAQAKQAPPGLPPPLVSTAKKPAPRHQLSQEGCPECTRRWHRFDHSAGRLVALEQHSGGPQALQGEQPGAAQGTSAQPPPLPREFAGIGTRSLGAAGRLAIRQLHEATFQCVESCGGPGK